MDQLSSFCEQPSWTISQPPSLCVILAEIWTSIQYSEIFIPLNNFFEQRKKRRTQIRFSWLSTFGIMGQIFKFKSFSNCSFNLPLSLFLFWTFMPSSSSPKTPQTRLLRSLMALRSERSWPHTGWSSRAKLQGIRRQNTAGWRTTGRWSRTHASGRAWRVFWSKERSPVTRAATCVRCGTATETQRS